MVDFVRHRMLSFLLSGFIVLSPSLSLHSHNMPTSRGAMTAAGRYSYKQVHCISVMSCVQGQVLSHLSYESFRIRVHYWWLTCHVRIKVDGSLVYDVLVVKQGPCHAEVNRRETFFEVAHRTN